MFHDATQEELLKALNTTNQNIFITGGAGVGKTYVLKQFRDKLPRDQYIVGAPTGVAALNANGQTLHRLFQIPFSIADVDYQAVISARKFSEQKAELFNKISILFIDEISMVRSDILSFIDRVLCEVRCDNSPFGGLRVIAIGDPFQLPPIVARHEKLSEPWFFQSEAWQYGNFHTYNLTKIYRQEDGSPFASVLNNIRKGTPSFDDIKFLNKRVETHSDDQTMILATVNRKVDEINTQNLRKIEAKEHTFFMKYENFDPSFSIEKVCPAEPELRLKVGARVMILVNGPGYVNGSLGTVKAINPDPHNPIVDVQLDVGYPVRIKKYKWTTEEASYANETFRTQILGEATQLPLRLGYAVTVHKSQGMSFPKMHFICDNIFERGQAYVALSRATSIEGLSLSSRLNKKSIITDSRIKIFMKGLAND